MKSVKKEPTFEESMARLEEIVGLLENGGVALDETILLYEEGAKIAAACSLKLEKAEQTVEIINESKNTKAEDSDVENK